jgi:hypothetical protein
MDLIGNPPLLKPLLWIKMNDVPFAGYIVLPVKGGA